MKTRVHLLLWLGVVGLCTGGSQTAVLVGQAYWSDPDIWWTASGMELPLEATRNAVEVRVDGNLLHRCLEEQRLWLKSDAGEMTVVTPEQVDARLNNWPAAQARLFSLALLPVFVTGMSLALLIIGLADWRRARMEQAGAPPEQASDNAEAS